MSESVAPKSGVNPGLKATLAIWLLSLLLLVLVGAAFSASRILAVILSGTSLVVPPFIFLLRKRTLIHSLGLARRPSVKDFLFGLAVGPASFGLSTAINSPITLVFPPPQAYLDALGSVAPRSILELTVWLIIVLIFVGPSEEFLSRGFVQQGLERRFGRGAGLMLASVLFGLSHLDPWSSVGVAVAGLVIGYVYQRRSYNLWAPIGVHVGHDWLAFAALYASLHG